MLKRNEINLKQDELRLRKRYCLSYFNKQREKKIIIRKAGSKYSAHK
jgi:hypothetical protein